VAVYPLIAPDPEPACEAGTVFAAVNAYAAEASVPVRIAMTMIWRLRRRMVFSQMVSRRACPSFE
jgi:hypothetical protein